MFKQYLNELAPTELREVFHKNVTQSITGTTFYNIVLDKLQQKEKKKVSELLSELELYLEPDCLYSTVSDNLNYGVEMKYLYRVEDVRNLAQVIKNLGIIPITPVLNKSFLKNTLEEVERLEFLKATMDKDYKKYFGVFNHHLLQYSFEDTEEQYNIVSTKFKNCLDDVNERLRVLVRMVVSTLKYNLNMTSNLKIMEDYFINEFSLEEESDKMFIYKDDNTESDYWVYLYISQTENYTLL